MPSESVRELIMRNIETTLSAISMGDYWHTVNTVSRSLRNPGDLKGVNIDFYSPAGTDVITPLAGGSSGTGITQTRMQIDVIAHVSNEVANDTDAGRLASDIENAFLADRYRGGNALNIGVISREIQTANDTGILTNVVLRFFVLYRHEFANVGAQV